MMKTVAIGSTNPVKIECVRQAFNLVFPNEEFEFTGVSVDSGVSDQPMSAVESINGATNRATLSLLQASADFGVGLEGGLEKIDDNWYDSGWIVVIDKQGRKGIGSTIRLIVPAEIMELIENGMELGHACDKFYKEENSKQNNGFFGLATNDLITRTSGYRDGVITALSSFIN